MKKDEEKSEGVTIVDVFEVAKALREKGATDDTLDCMVHETANQIASDVNNAGIEEQVYYLLFNGVTSGEIFEALED